LARNVRLGRTRQPMSAAADLRSWAAFIALTRLDRSRKHHPAERLTEAGRGPPASSAVYPEARIPVADIRRAPRNEAFAGECVHEVLRIDLKVLESLPVPSTYSSDRAHAARRRYS